MSPAPRNSQPGDANPKLLPPPRVPDHELLRRIGRGAYGEVWLARSATGAFRAVKIVHRQSFDHDRPFAREFEGILKFEPVSRTHDSQVDILHVGRGDDCFYYVMELADDQATGGQINSDNYAPRTLKSDLLFHGRLPFEECVRIGLALTTALENLHGNGLAHRDVKPSNIIFVNGVPKLADIGLVAGVEATRSYVGTEGFAAPEGPGTAQADLYSLGKVLYEISTGKDRQEFPELPTQLRELPEREGLVELNAVIARACRHDPKDRYPSATAMRADLELLQSGKSLARLHRTEKQLRFVQRAGAVVTVIAALIAAGWLWQARQARQMKRLATEARENLYAADISQIQHALETDNLRQARELLRNHIPKPGEPDLRGFEWRYLWQQCRGGELSGWQGHEDVVTRVAFSPDGRLLITGSYDDTAKVWELASHRLLAALTGHTGGVFTASFSPKGDVVATGSPTGLYVWDARTFQPLRSIPQPAGRARFSPDGQYFAAAATNLILRDTRTWQIVSTLELPESKERVIDQYGLHLAFSPQGRQVAVVLGDGVRLLGIPDLHDQAVLKDQMPWVRFVAFSPDGRTLATSTMGHEVKLWDIKTRTPLRALTGHSGSVSTVAFSPDGTRLATCSFDQTVKLWDVASGMLIRTFKGHTEEVWDVAFSPDGKRLVSVSKDGAVKLWDPSAAPAQVRELSSLYPFGFDSIGNLVCAKKGAAEYSAGYFAVDPETLQQASASTDLSDRVGFFGCLSGDGSMIGLQLAGSESPKNALQIWDLQRRELICSVENHFLRIAFAPKTRLVATGTSNRTVTVWQLPQGLPRFVLTNTSAPLAFSPDERMLVTADRVIKLWSIENDHLWLVASLTNRARGPAAFSPDGHTLACGSTDGIVRLFAMPSGREMTSLVGHKRNVTGISFSPDGRTLATVADEGTVRLWHLATRRELLRFATPVKDALGGPRVMFSRDGRTLVALIAEREEFRTYVWLAPPFDEIAVAEGQ